MNSFSGFFDGAVNAIFRYYTDDYDTLDTAMAQENWGIVGQSVGDFIKLFLENEVPSYTYGDY